MALGLALIFPQKGLERQLAETGRSDPLTVEYLRAFLSAKPDSPGLTLLLARQLMQLGRFDEARIALRPLLAGNAGAFSVEAGVHEFELLEREAYRSPDGAEGREQGTREAVAQLRRLLAQELTTVQLDYLARRAVALGDAASAVELHRRMAERGRARGAREYAEAAALVLGLGDHAVAASLYFRAQEASSLPERRREYFRQGVATLMAGNHYAEAMREAERHLGTLADDTETLKFLARAAQAADRADLAQRYARMLLRMALLKRWQFELAASGEPGLTSLARRAALAAEEFGVARVVRTGGTGPGVPFDDETYTLGFNIFVAAGNLVDALRVAESAVQQAPASDVWRKRLAEVAEWRGAPQLALAQWLAHARMTGAETSWDAALRLARGLADDAALVAVLSHKLAREPVRLELVDEIVAIHERAGQPEAAIAFLEARVKGPERRAILERLEALATRAGRDTLAFESLLALNREFGPTIPWTLAIASRHYLTGDLRAAFAALDALSGRAGTGETAYWQMYAELARILELDDKAIAGYRRLLQSEKYSEGDLDNLVAIFDAMRPGEAARVAEFAFARFGRPELALQVLYQHGRAGNRGAIARFLAGLKGEMLARLEKDTRFLGARAAHLQSGGDLRGALADFVAVDRLEPGNADNRAAILWTLIALRDAPRLKAALVAWAPQAEREPRLWGPYAAAHMGLNRQAEALTWFRRQVDQRDDYLWQLAFAECLEANAQPDVAWRVRRRAWLELRRPEVLARLSGADWRALRDRLAALSQVFTPGDRAKAIVEALLAADLTAIVRAPAPAPLPSNGAELAAALAEAMPMPSASTAREAPAGALPAAWFARPAAAVARPPAADNDATVKELALAWALNNEAHDLARAWLITRHAGTLSRPLWGELSVALASSDRETLARLLDDLPDWLPMYDRVEAALRVGAPALARTLAFEQLDHLQHDEELHLRFTTMVTEDPARLAIARVAIRQSPLAIDQTRIEASADLTPRLKLGVTLTLNEQSTQDETQLVNLPRSDSTIAAFARYRNEALSTTLTVFHRRAMREFDGMRLDYELPVAPRVRLAGAAGVNLAATELAVLRAGGVKDGIENTLTWAPEKSIYARAGLAWNRYLTQERTELGHGSIATVEAGYRVRLEYPDLALRLTGTRADFSSTGVADERIRSLLPPDLRGAAGFMPGSYTQWGAGLGWGMHLQERHTRALRPFFDMALFHNSVTGAGSSVRLGAAGSLAGQDHLTIYLGRSSGTPGAPQGYRELGINYQWFY